MALKGRTAQDRADWENEFLDQLQGRTQKEKDNAYVRYNARQKYGNDFVTDKSVAELEDIWNKDYDDSIAGLQNLQTGVSSLGLDTTQRTDETAIETHTIEPIHMIGDKEEKEVEDIFKENSEVFKQRLSYYDDKYGRNAFAAKDATQSIKEVANVASPYYRKFNGTDYIQFDDTDWSNIAKQYMAYQDAYGEEQAVEYLRKTIYDEVDRNTSWIEDQWTGFKGMGLSAIQDIGVLLTALPVGAYEYFNGEHEIEGANGLTEFIDAIVDNRATRYFNDAKQWGTLDPERQRKNKELGLSDLQIMDDYDVMTGDASLLEQMFNKNTLAHLTDQYGFTLASLFMGGLATKATSKIFKGIKGASYARNMEKATKSMTDVKNILNRWQTAENVIDRALIPGLIGQGEGIIEALQTKQSIMEDGKQEVDQRYQSEVEQTFQGLYDTYYQKMFDELTKPKTFTASNNEQGYSGTFSGGGMTSEEANDYIINALWDQAEAVHAEQYQASLDQLDYAATRGARNNFLMNSAINGLIYSTLKAPLFGNKLLGRMRTSRAGKLFDTKPKTQVDIHGKATGKLPWWKATYEAVQEPVGEGLEEAAQYISDKREQGRSGNNLSMFLDYKYGALPGMQDINVGHVFWEDYAAANLAGFKAFADKELYLNTFYGLASSVLGGVAGPQRAQTADGKKGKFFQRGVNAKGETEKWYDVARRVTPWRSGISQGIQRVQAINEELKNEAEALQAWLEDPKNKAKFDGTNGTLRWAKAMQESAEAGDEFGFRNTAKGKATNDAIMLQKLRGTEFYNAFMANIETARNLTMNSPEARAYINEFRSELSNNSEDMTDEDIVEQIRNNANTMMSEYEKVQEEGEKIERLVGQVDDDTKESLIYGQMMIDDFQERRDQIEEDMRKIKIEPVEVEAKKDEDGVAETLMTESEIMQMSPAERAQVLTSDSKAYSEAQKKIINNIVAQGVAQDGDFIGKIKDAAKLQNIQMSYMQNYAKVLMDPDNYGKFYAANAKIESIRAMYAKKYETLRDIEDYDTFAQEMDKLLSEGNVYERNTITKQLEKEATTPKEDGAESNFTRYKRSRQEIADVIKHASTEGRLNELDEQDTHNFVNAISYLTHKGINIHDRDAVTTALLETDATGNNLFKNYANTVAPYQPSSADEEVKDYTPEQVITLVHDVVASYEKKVAEQNWKTAPVEVTVDPQQAAGPKESPNVLPGVFATASKSQEEVNKELQQHGEGTVTEGTVITETGDTRSKTPVEQQDEQVSEDSIAYNFVDVSTPAVVKAALRIEQYIKTSTLLEEEKNTALEVLERLAEEPYTSVEELVNSFNAEANRLDIQADAKTAEMMRKISSRVIIEAKEDAAKAKVQHKEETDKVRELITKSVLARKALGFSGDKDIRDASSMQTLQIDGKGGLKETKSVNPEDPNYSPLLRYIKEHNVEGFLSESNITRDEPVYFICDPVLAQEQQRVWEKNGFQYSKKNLPLIACVKSDKGTVEIGGEKYQPIGIMPHTGSQNYLGSNRLEKIRDFLDESADAPFLVSDSKGVIETRLSNHLYAQTPAQLQQNISFMESYINNLYAEEKKQWRDTPPASRKALAAYKAAKAKFLEGIQKAEIARKDSKQTRSALIWYANNYKGEKIPFEIFFPEVTATKGIEMEKTVGEMLQDGDVSLMSANSRMRRWGNALSNFVKQMETDEIVTSPDGELSDTSAKLLSNWSEQLDKQLRNFLVVPRGYSLKLEAGPFVDGSRQTVITYTDGTNTFELGTVQKGSLSDEQQFALLKNLILDKEGKVRTNNEGKELVKWQVTFEDAAEIKSSEVAKGNFSQMFDDGIFEISKERTDYALTSITLEAPYTIEGARMVFKQKVVTNKDNATTSTEVPIASEQVTKDGVTIDANTGTVIDGELPAATNQATEIAANQAKEIAQEAHTQEDATTYKKFGLEYTNPLLEDAESPEGTVKQQALDLFRHFAFGSSKTGGNIIHNLLNVTEKAISNFEAQVQAWKNGLTANGITLLDKEVLATWQTEGNRFGIPVNLAYDAKGNWKVYIPVVEKHTKVDEQTAKMFVASLENEYDIKVHDYNFVELSVQMPKGNNVTVSNGQVITNKSHRYDGARPTLSSTSTVLSSDITTYAQAVQSISEKISANPEDIEDTPAPQEPMQWNDGLFGGEQGETIGFENAYIPANQQWGVFAGRNLNVQKTIENLEANGITEEDWILMIEPEREQELECKGVY